MKIEIPVEMRDAVQKADLEKCSLRDLMIHILANDVELPQERWEMLKQDYTDKFIEFEKQKEKVEDLISQTVGDKEYTWRLDYKSNEIEVAVSEEENIDKKE